MADQKWLVVLQSLVGVILLVLAVALVYALFEVWPAVEQVAASSSDSPAGDQAISLFGSNLTLSPQSTYIAVVVILGGLGSFIHAATSFSSYVGNRTFKGQWTWWYILRPFIGAALALFIYFALFGGLLTIDTQTGDVNPFGVAAISGLAGLFSKQASDWLRDVAQTVFKTKDERKDKLDEAAPEIESLVPDSVDMATIQQQGEVTIQITGRGFEDGASVLINGRKADRVSVASAELIRVTIQGDLLQPGTVDVVVRNSGPSGLASEPKTLDVE